MLRIRALIALALTLYRPARPWAAMAVVAIRETALPVAMLFARPDNFYWGMLIAPTLFIGLVFAPAALGELARSLLPKAHVTAPRSPR